MEDVVEALAAEPRVYLLHHNADADAVGAAIALSRRWPGLIAAHADVSAAGRRLADRLGVKVAVDPPLIGFRVGVVVDTGSPGPLGALPKDLPLVIIDHHRAGGWPHAKAQFVDPESTSTCEVALKLLWALGEGVAPDEALALLCGLVADTQRFRFATKDTLTNAFVLMDNGAEMKDCLEILEQPSPEERSERIARLRAAQRATFEEMNGLLVAMSQVNAYEASAAGALVRVGADVALVAAQRGDQASVSARQAPSGKVDLARLMQRAAKNLGPGWSGGGHAGAAGLQGAGEAGSALAAVRAALAQERGG